MGLSFALFASVTFACIPIVVERYNVGIAYGVTYSIINLFLVISPMIVGELFASKHSYHLVIIKYNINR